MNNFHYTITVILILFFLLITFSISFIEKICDWKNNLKFMKIHFKDSILKNHVFLLLLILLMVEFLASVFIIIGLYQIIIFKNFNFAMYGIELCSVSIIFMLIGQRIVKDYVGATSLTIYFILTIFSLFVLNQ